MTDVQALTAQIVAAHVGNNATSTTDLPRLIRAVFDTLFHLGEEPPEVVEQLPAVPIKKSVFPDYIVCLEDGKKMKMLKRHLLTSYNMTPTDYRAKWKLPDDYPMVSPNYATHRSKLALSIGLGRKPVEEMAEASLEPEATVLKARRAKGAKG